MSIRQRLSIVCLFVAALAPPAAIGEPDLFDGFAPGWRDHWQEQSYFSRPTRYEVTTAEGHPVLHATSHAAHAGLVRRLALSPPIAARLEWRWKITAPLSDNLVERERAGDDYAVRVCVIFETSLLPFRTRSINYVWAAHETVGAIYASPYSRNVGMVVLRSGPAQAGHWCAEERDVGSDYAKFFGEPPTQLNAIAVLVDTDNTGLEAEAWLADLRLVSTPPIPRP